MYKQGQAKNVEASGPWGSPGSATPVSGDVLKNTIDGVIRNANDNSCTLRCSRCKSVNESCRKVVLTETVTSLVSNSERFGLRTIGVARGAKAPKFLAYLVILCSERLYPKQNTVARLKSSILTKKKFGLSTPLLRTKKWMRTSTALSN